MIKRYLSEETKRLLSFSVTHRLVVPTAKHGPKSACGIRIVAVYTGDSVSVATTPDGHSLVVSDKGKPFDCKRCRRVLELRYDNRSFSMDGK